VKLEMNIRPKQVLLLVVGEAFQINRGEYAKGEDKLGTTVLGA
jgi:hypothetical protein